jgi:murein endopeptidase
MGRRRGFGVVSARERRQADLFFAELVHGPRAPAPAEGDAAESIALFTLGASVGASPATNARSDVSALKNRLIALGYDWVRPGDTIDTDTIYTIRLFQSIIAGRNELRGDGRVDVPGTTYQWLRAVNAPRWQTMPAGSAAEGFHNFELTDTSDHHDYGTDWMAAAIRGAGAHYRDNYLRTHTTAALLTINDVSLTRGGDTPDHAGHETGLACDIRLPRTDGTAPGSTTHTTATYDRDATRAMIQAIRAQPQVTAVYFNDPVLIAERLCASMRGHDDHVHFQLGPPTRGATATFPLPSWLFPFGLVPTLEHTTGDHGALSFGVESAAAEAWEQTTGATLTLRLRVGDERVVRATARRLPARSYAWTSADPAIASVTPLGPETNHPNRARIRALQAGNATIQVRYVAQDGHVATGSIAVVIATPAPAVDRQAVVDALRQEAIARATRRDTFLTERAVTDAIDGRASRPELATLFDAKVDALVAQHAADPAQVPALRQRSAAEIVGLLEDDRFRCATDGNRVVIHREVVDGMKLTWTRSGEAQDVAGAICRAAPTRCPTAHQALHTTGDASHFMSASQLGARVVELAGLFGADLRPLANQTARASHAIKALPTAAPLATLSFVAIRSGTHRELHVARQDPRQVGAVVDGAEWRSLAFEATPGTDYDLFKGRWFEASLHRQWGTEPNVAWIVGLCRFYFDRTGQRLGVGDISHVLGESMTDHGSHQVGRDVDVYVLDPPAAAGGLPTAYWCEGTQSALVLKALRPPASGAAQPAYTAPSASDPALAAADATRITTRYATIAAYCVATVGRLDAFVWHGARGIRDEALRVAQQAWDDTVAAGAGTTASPGWRARWGTGPATRAALVLLPNARLIGDGAGSYGPGQGWPPHQDHVHIRLQ